jgi:DNA-binding SARP family transcriptional activator
MAMGDVEREDGNIAAAAQHYDTAIAIAGAVGNVLATCSARIRRSYLHTAQGNPADAVDDATEALALADRVGFSLFQAWSRNARGAAYLRLGLLDEAAADFDAARQVQERLGSTAVSVALSGLGDVHQARGELTQARGAYERALAAAERSGNVGNRVFALTGLALVVEDDEAEAERAAAAAIELAHGSNLGRALVTSGWIALRRDDRVAALAAADEALANARRRGEPELTAEALELRAMSSPEPDRDRLEEARAIWKEMDARLGVARTELALARLDDAGLDTERAESALRLLGVRRIGAGAGLLREVAPSTQRSLRIRTLGHFALLRDGQPVPVSEWQSKKARDLLKILVANRGHAVARDVLVELLWPEDDPRKTANRLSVALNVVRGVLDPARMHEQDHYLASDGDAIRLVVGRISVDVEDFIAAASAGVTAYRRGDDDAPELLERAEASYGGDFLEEERYEDWAAALRDETRDTYLDVLRALAAIEAERERRSATYHLRALAVDPYDEEIHLGLVSMLADSGRHGESRRAYRQYVDRMREIDLEPAAFPALRRP